MVYRPACVRTSRQTNVNFAVIAFSLIFFSCSSFSCLLFSNFIVWFNELRVSVSLCWSVYSVRTHVIFFCVPMYISTFHTFSSSLSRSSSLALFFPPLIPSSAVNVYIYSRRQRTTIHVCTIFFWAFRVKSRRRRMQSLVSFSYCVVVFLCISLSECCVRVSKQPTCCFFFLSFTMYSRSRYNKVSKKWQKKLKHEGTLSFVVYVLPK